MQFLPALFIPAFALTSMLISGHVLAEGKGDHGRLAKVCDQIECTDQQEQDIRQVFKQARIDGQSDREAIRELREQVAAEWVKDQPDEAKLDKLQTRIAGHEANLAERHREAMMELHDVLDATQRAQVVELMSERKGKGKDKAKAKAKGKAKPAKPEADR